MEPIYDIRDLCRLTGESARTIHFYARNGLVPPAGTAGRGPRYHDGHVARLRLIRLLQKEHLPLGEIRTRLEGLTDEQVIELSRTASPPAESPGADDRSALDYVRGVLAGERRSSSTPDLLTHYAPSRVERSARSERRSMAVFCEAPASPPPQSDPFPRERSQWDRITLAPDVELHVRRPQSRDANRRIERLLEAARGLFSED